jgi:AcrR family transcriptional regulator
MSVQKPDRRIQRTRKLLRDSLTELIMEKDYDKITVQDIIDHADVGRSTFYTHFLDKDDLLIGEMSVFRIDVAEHFEMPAEGVNPLSAIKIFEHVQQNYPLYHAMIGTNGIELAKRMARKKTSEHLEDRVNQLSEMGHVLPLPAPVIIQYLTGAIFGLITWWLDNNMPYTPEEMDAMFQKLVMKGLESLMTEEVAQ